MKAKKGVILSVALAGALLVGGGLLSQTQRQDTAQTDELIITFIDVGQGDSTFIILPNGETMLIDAGESTASEAVINTVKSANVQTIDYLIATHPHSDYIGGMLAVIEAFNVKSIWMPDVIHTTQTFERLLDTVDSAGLSISIAEYKVVIYSSDDLRMEFLAPVKNEYEDLNDYSAVMLLAYSDVRFLFLGDAGEISEADILASGYDISADVIKAGHHGSSSSSSQKFITAVSPTYAIISCGADNQYGHPHSQTLDVLGELDVEVLRTDVLGVIVFTYDGVNLAYHAIKEN